MNKNFNEILALESEIENEIKEFIRNKHKVKEISNEIIKYFCDIDMGLIVNEMSKLNLGIIRQIEEIEKDVLNELIKIEAEKKF